MDTHKASHSNINNISSLNKRMRHPRKVKTKRRRQRRVVLCPQLGTPTTGYSSRR
jgi:hypothetical protein